MKEKLTENLFFTFFGMLMSFLVTTLCILLLAFLTYQLHIPQQGIRIGITITYVLSCFLGGFLSGRKREKKYIKGCITGVCYVIVLIIFSCFKYDSISFLQEGRTLVIAAICIGSATLGGMLA